MSEEATDHVEANVRRMADLHAKHTAGASWLQRLVLGTTRLLGRPGSVGAVTALAVGWCALNLLGPRFGWPSPDPPPFAWLELAATVFALFTTLLILATQRREEQLARQRAQLTLNLVALGEQKIAKVIELLEEQRRENPLLPTRSDRTVEDMSRSADPDHVLERIIETHEGEEGA